MSKSATKSTTISGTIRRISQYLGATSGFSGSEGALREKVGSASITRCAMLINLNNGNEPRFIDVAVKDLPKAALLKKGDQVTVKFDSRGHVKNIDSTWV